MTIQLIKIGNSKGIRLPKSVIEQCKLGNEIEIEIMNNKLVLYSKSEVRKDWAKAFQKMHNNKDDIMLNADMIESKWDDTEWTW